MLLTAAALLGLVGLPLLYVLLQAVFPGWSQGELSGAFSLFVPMLLDPDLLGLLGNTLRLGIAVVVVSALVAIPLGALRALARIPGGAIWDLLFLIPFMIPPYIAALSWMLTLQPRGYAEQLIGLSASDFLFSFYGIVFVMVLNVFSRCLFRRIAHHDERWRALRSGGAGEWGESVARLLAYYAAARYPRHCRESAVGVCPHY
jgi:iron(III) transport system permease protein